MRSSVHWAAGIAIIVAMGGISRTISARPADRAPERAANLSPALSWEDAFPVAAAQPAVYLDAHFVGSDGAPHRLQVWRRGTAFLHRRTDDALDLYLEKADGQADYRYRLFDHRRRVALAVKRGQLYRIGVFSDWFGLAHVVERPKTPFTVRAVPALPDEHRRDCSWRLLVRNTPGDATRTERSRVCWSSAWGVPLVIRSPGAKGVWEDRFVADQVDARVPAGEATTLPDTPEGYAFFDAGKEIAPEVGD